MRKPDSFCKYVLLIPGCSTPERRFAETSVQFTSKREMFTSVGIVGYYGVFGADLLFCASSPQGERQREREREGIRERLCVFVCEFDLKAKLTTASVSCQKETN